MARLLVVAIVLSILGRGAPADAADAYSAVLVGSSASVTALPGDAASFAAVFLNTGTATWQPGVVGLLACSQVGGACATADAGSWPAWLDDPVLDTTDVPVGPGGLAFFTYTIVIPVDAEPGTRVRLSGEVGSIASGVAFGNSGYYGEVRVPRLGIAARLTISGMDSPRSVGDPLRISVDVDDVNVALVGDDPGTVISAALDPATCGGTASGGAYLESAAATASGGRALFTVRSFVAVPGCRIRVSAPGLRSAEAKLEFDSGPEAGLQCSTPRSVGPGRAGMIAVQVVDRFGNPVFAVGSITLTHESGSATALLSSETQDLRRGAAVFTVGGIGEGDDVYTAASGGYTCRVDVASTAR